MIAEIGEVIGSVGIQLRRDRKNDSLIRLELQGMGVGEGKAQLDYNYRDDFYTNPNNATINAVESYDLSNARVGYEPSSGIWSVHVWVKNLTDNDDIIYASRSFLGLPRGIYMEPRMRGLTFRYNFGG